MWRWETFVIVVTLLMVSGRLRSRRSGRGAHNSQRYSRSSPHIRKRPLLRGPHRLDAERTGHLSACARCGVETVVPMVACRLERGPWRLVWWCEECDRLSVTLVAKDFVPMLLDMEVAGGLLLSSRELELWSDADEDDVSEAFEAELLS